MSAPPIGVLNETDVVSSYREWSEPLASEVIECWWEQRIPAAAGEHIQRVLPDGHADIIVGADGRAVVAGPTMAVALPRLAGGAHLRGLRLRTDMLASALGCSGGELRDRTVPLDAILAGARGRRVAEAVWTGRVPDGWSAVRTDERVRRAVVRLGSASPTDVSSVATEVGLTTRHLRRVVLDRTGLGPRAIQRVGRLQRFLRMADGCGPSVGLAGLAADAGYADQAHLAREVRQLSGLTPTALLRERRGV